MLAQVHGVVLAGVSGAMVCVEVDVGDGLPSVGMVGLPDTSVTEARWRARCAIEATGGTWPTRRITINLSPAELRKQGAGLDLPIAVGVLVASGAVPSTLLATTTFVAELGLDGSLRPSRGTLAGALAARDAGLVRIVVPAVVAGDLVRIAGLEIAVADRLDEVVALLHGEPARSAPAPGALSSPPQPDLRDLRGHALARTGLEIAAAGGHHLALVGAPGVGKTLLAERLPGLLPPLDDADALEVAAIHGLIDPRPHAVVDRPPCRAPHHGASAAAVLGTVQGSRAVPGAVTLAHHGVLILDEAPEFSRPVLEGLRQPMESGTVALARSGWSGMVPARFQLVLTANPCPCGQRIGNGAACSCPPAAVRRYAARLSGPVMDRVDIRMVLARPTDAELADPREPEPTAAARERVAEARARSAHRFTGRPYAVNAQIPAGDLRRDWQPDADGAALLADLERRSMNLRGPDRILRMAWTVADLAGRARPVVDDVATAAGLRGPGTLWAS